MLITLIIYTIIFLMIFFKGFYKSIPFIKSSSVRKNAESLATSIQLESLLFYLNMGKINLFSLFLNFLLISLISCTLIPDFIFNNIAYCQDWNNINNHRSEFDNISRIIEETYEISSTKRSYIYHSNYKYIGIFDYQKVFQGFSQDFNDILNKQNILFTNEKFINLLSNNNKNIDMRMYNKSYDLLSLNANAYKNIWFSYKNNNSDSLKYYLNDSEESYKLFNKMLNLNDNDKIMINKDVSKNIRSFLGGYQYQINKFNIEAIKFFNSLENVKEIAKINLSQKGLKIENTIIFEDKKIIIKNPYELNNYCNKKLLLTLKKELLRGDAFYLINALESGSSFDIHTNINHNHYSIFMDLNNLKDKGFFLKEKSQINNSNEPFNRIDMNEDMLKEYDIFIETKDFYDEQEGDY